MPETSKQVGASRASDQVGTKTTLRSLTPYTVHNLDAAISHLEIAMAADNTLSIFSRSYWCRRVMEIRSTPGILQAQMRRVEYLLDRFEDGVSGA